MLKKFFASFVLLLALFIFDYSLITPVLSAEREFNTDYNVTYKVKDTGITEVKNQITLTNLFSNLYATSYSIILESIDPQNVSAYDQIGPLEIHKIKENSKTTLEIKFNDTLVGKDKSRTFNIVYDEVAFAIRTGEVWEISIPRIVDNTTFGSYFVNLEVPVSLGQEAYISPQPESKSTEGEFYLYKFDKDAVSKTGITAGFGQFQVFSFTLNYHLENPLARSAETEISLPPDTSFQKMYYSDITPRPSLMYVDTDGNWIAKYVLKARERIDVTATGEVQIFASLRPYPKPTSESLMENLKELEYWQISDPEILKLSKTLKTPKQIYDYVSNYLTYNYDRVKPNVERLGASSALQNPTQAICMEFTDLFIALARAAGIAAREVNGFAYTENPEIQPSSLVNDVLHAWPEYYDLKSEAWIPVDPTWGSTTGGVDYFSKLDLRHFSFVIHGKDSKMPYAAGSYKLGSNPQKDIFVSFGSLPTIKNSELKINATLAKFIPLISNKLNIEITNPGPVAIYNLNPHVYFDSQEIGIQNNLEVLLPFQTYKTYVDIPFSFLGTKTPDSVTFKVNGQEVIVATHKTQVILYNLLFISVVSLIILITFIFRFKKWKFPKKNF